MRAVAVIPARWASSRFPAKVLACETGKYLVQHVYERAAAARSVERVIVATDDSRVCDAVVSFGGEVALTRADHPSGTDRVAEVAAGLDAEIVVNLQGDEPEIDPGMLDELVAIFERPDCVMATLACPFSAVPGGDPADPNAVKVVVDARRRALYFSRACVPHARDAVYAPGSGPYLHLGTYAYRREFLLELAKLEPTALEQTERLEQLRPLEHGHEIDVVLADRAVVGIDTPEDYAAFVARHRLTESPDPES
ncbi:MAG: 3-deoxy-manno-octulosonate cytidylyltransferase [bacterium]|nr:3-deoxy-manno-octulosonate cytidylyltransferase [bacterium]